MKKSFVFAVSLMLIMALLSFSSLAQTDPTGPSLTVSDLKLGDDRQDRSNPRHDDDDDSEVNVTGTITVTNNGNSGLNKLRVTVSLGRDASGQGISLSDLLPDVSIPSEGVTLAVGESTEVRVEMRVPEELDAVDKKGRKAAFNVVDIVFQADHRSGTISETVNVEMEAENKLIIDDAKITFDDTTETIDEGDSVEGVKPGNEILIDFQIESRYDDDEDVGIEDIELTVEGGGDLDFEEEENVDDLDPEETDSVEVKFEVDEDAGRGDEDIEITLLGEDENGAMHGEMWEVTLEIEREDHEIDINLVILEPATISCEKYADLKVEIRNTGRRSEDETYIKITSSELNYQVASERLDLDEDDEVTRTFTVPVPPDTLPGSYRLTVETYYDTIRRSMAEVAVLTKEECRREAVAPEIKEEDKAEEIVVVTELPKPVPSVPQVDNPVVVPPKETVPIADNAGGSLLEGNAFMAFLILGYLVVLCGGAIVAFRLLKK